MYTTRSFIRGLVTLSLVAVLSGYGIVAAEQGENRMSDQPSVRQQSEQQAFSPATNVSIRRATQLIGEPVKNPQGEKLGTIYDLVLTPDLDQVSYVALSRGGIFGIGRNLYAIPWSSVRLGATGAYVAPISEDELTQWRGFRPSAWPSDPSRSWTSGGARTAEEPQTAQQKRSVQERRVSRIRGMAVKTPEGLGAGHIQDLAVVMDTGKIQYSIVSFGGIFGGVGAEYAAVPQGAIDFQPDQRVAQLNVGRDVLRENAFAPGQFPDLGDPSYAMGINQAYGMESGDTVLGYVPAGEAEREPAAPGAARPETDRTMPGAPAAGGLGSVRIDPQATFDASAIKTMEGVVTIVGKSAPAGTDSDILLLQVRTDAGALLTVHAGPINYVSKQDFYAVSGDRIRVTGAPARGDSSIFLAVRISKEGQVLTLRNREGKPLWDSSSQQEPRPGTTTETPRHESTEKSSGEDSSSEHI